MPGYIGLDCSLLCPYPYYGVQCQRTCNCSRDLCNVSTGCIRIVTVRRDCDPGYFGKNCRAKCSYPYYGEECQGQCHCDEDSCDVSIGCTNVTKDISKTAVQVRHGIQKHNSVKNACQVILECTVHHRVPIHITEWTVKEHATVAVTFVMCLQDVLE